MRTTYATISIPDGLAESLGHVAQHQGLGFKSKGDVAKHAIRAFLLRLIRLGVLLPDAVLDSTKEGTRGMKDSKGDRA